MTGDNFDTVFNYKRSHRNMGEALKRLYEKRCRTSKEDPQREVIDSKIELLKIIRKELKGLIRSNE